MKYRNVRVDLGYFDERPLRHHPDATVEIGPRLILVQWREGARLRRFEGVRCGQGHFLLRSDDAATQATLHRFQYSEILEGYWERNGKSGFWRVYLPPVRKAKVTRLGARLPARRRLKAAA